MKWPKYKKQIRPLDLNGKRTGEHNGATKTVELSAKRSFILNGKAFVSRRTESPGAL